MSSQKDGQPAEPADPLANLSDASSLLNSACGYLRARTRTESMAPAAEIKSAEEQVARAIRGVRDAAFAWQSRITAHELDSRLGKAVTIEYEGR